MPLTISDINEGDVIDYRGSPARVALVWKADTDPRPGGITAPMGMEIEWVDSNAVQQRTRLVWPEFSAAEQYELDVMSEEERDAAVTARLASDIVERTFDPWTE